MPASALSPDELATLLPELKAKVEAMTPGPWRQFYFTDQSPTCEEYGSIYYRVPDCANLRNADSSYDAAGIVALRNAAPALISTIEAQAERVRELEAERRIAEARARHALTEEERNTLADIRRVVSMYAGNDEHLETLDRLLAPAPAPSQTGEPPGPDALELEVGPHVMREGRNTITIPIALARELHLFTRLDQLGYVPVDADEPDPGTLPAPRAVTMGEAEDAAAREAPEVDRATRKIFVEYIMNKHAVEWMNAIREEFGMRRLDRDDFKAERRSWGEVIDDVTEEPAS